MTTTNYWLRKGGRSISRRRFLAGSGVAFAGSAAILAGCGDDDDDAPAPTPTQTQPGTTPGTTPTGTPAGEQPRRGGTMRLWKPVADSGLDPAIFHLNNTEVINRVINFPIAYQVTKDLVAADGMVSWEQADPTTLVWKVRPGMKFHNGDPMDAAAWAFSVQRVIDHNKRLGGSTHTPPPTFTYIDRLEVVDPLTVREIWKAPRADALRHRARHYYGWVNPKIVETQGDEHGQIQDLPPGSGGGPYTLTKRDAEGTTVTRWPDYFDHEPADDGFVAKGGPYIQQQDTRILPDRTAAKAAFSAGNLDFLGALDALEVADFRANQRVAVVGVPAAGTSLMGMDGGKFFDERARLAIQKGFNYTAFIASIRAGNGMFQMPVQRAMSAFNTFTDDDLKKWYSYQPTEARALWNAAAPPIDTLRILIASGDPLVQDIFDFAAQSYQQSLGVRTEVIALDSNAWASRAIDRTGDVKTWELLGYGAGTAGGLSGDPADRDLVHFDPRGYGINAFNFYLDSPHASIREGSQKFTEMMDKQAAEVDAERRVQLVTELQTWILDHHWCNFALPSAKEAFIGFSSRLRDFAPDDWLNFYGIRRHSIWLADA